MSLLRGEDLNRVRFRNKKSLMFQSFRNSQNQRELLLKESLRILKEGIFIFRSLIVCAEIFALGNTNRLRQYQRRDVQKLFWNLS